MKVSGRRSNLSATPRLLIGRDAYLDELEDLYTNGVRLVTLRGGPGIGKTRTAFGLAERAVAARRYPGGVWFCDLSEAETESSVTAALSRVLIGADASPSREHDGDEAVARAVANLGDTLIVLDNFEQVVEHAPGTVGRWLAEAPCARILVTSRVQLAIEGEVCREVLPLATDDAIALFEARAFAETSRLRPSDADRQVIRDVVDRLDGVPLAIELAASRTATLSLRELQDLLGRSLTHLAGTRRDLPTRHRSLSAAIDASWTELSNRGRAALRQCSVFRGGFSLDAAERVLDLAGAEGGATVIDALDELVAHSLVTVERPAGASGDTRFRLFEAVREFAAARLDKDERVAAQRRHADYYLELGQQWGCDLFTPNEEPALEVLGREYDNLIAVHVRCRKREPARAAAAVVALRRYIDSSGLYSTHACLFDSAIQCAQRSGDDMLEARARWARASLVRHLHQLAEVARADLLRVRDIAHECGELTLEAHAHMVLAYLSYYDMGAKAALPQWVQAEALYRRADSPAGVANSLFNQLLAALDAMNVDRAQALLDEAFPLARAAQTAHSRVLPYAHVLKAAVLQARGRFDDARSSFAIALDLCEAADVLYRAELVTSLGVVECQAGRWEDAISHLEEARETYERAGLPHHAGLTYGFLAIAVARAGDAERAAALLRTAAPMLERMAGLGGDIIHRAAATVIPGAPAAPKRYRDPHEPLPNLARIALSVAQQCARTRADDPTAGVLRVASGGRWFEFSGAERVHLGRRHTLRRVLAVLTDHRIEAPGDPVPADELIASCWPDDRSVGLRNRLYVSISKLRKLGLAPALATRGDGYMLRRDVSVEQVAP